MDSSNGFNTEEHYIFFIIIGISIFILGETTRSIFSSNKANQINFLYTVISVILLIKYIYYMRVEMKYVYLLIIFTGITIINAYFQGRNISYFALMISTFIIPLFFSTMKLDKSTSFKLFDKFLYIYNILCIVLLISGVIDYLTHGQIQYILAKNLIKGEMSDLIMFERSSGIYRFYSFIGHPLDNAKYFLIFFILNSIYAKYYEAKINKYILVFSTILGLTLSGSKTGMVVGLFLVLFCSDIKKHKYIYYFVFILIAFFIFNSSLFKENLMQRYTQGVKSGDMSTGRNELLTKWVDSDAEKPTWFLGGGAGYSRVISKSLGYGINFEYPLIMFAYDYSIIGVAFIYIIIFVNPIICFIKRKDYFILINFLALSLYINGNNGIANFSDSLARVCFLIVLFKNIEDPNKDCEVSEEKICVR